MHCWNSPGDTVLSSYIDWHDNCNLYRHICLKGKVTYHAGKYEGTPCGKDYLFSGISWQHFLVFDRALLGRSTVNLEKAIA